MQESNLTLRPVYHFGPRQNWMNDPNGLCYVDGWYHLFYQYNPSGDQWGSIHWGHARSSDLIHWEELPVALSPDHDRGEEHCFSGSLVAMPGERPRIFYTSIPFGERAVSHRAEQWVAYGSDDLMEWPASDRRKLMDASIHTQSGHMQSDGSGGGAPEVIDWRDPFVFRHDGSGRWAMLLGGTIDGTGAVLVYASPDLENWSFVRVLYRNQEQGSFLECPNIGRIGKDHVLLLSNAFRRVEYRIGTLTPDLRWNDAADDGSRTGILDFGELEGFYAPQLLHDAHGSLTMIGWASEFSRKASTLISGYNGAQSLPRRLSQHPDGGLAILPHPALQGLRQEHLKLSCEPGVEYTALPALDRRFELNVRASTAVPDGLSIVMYAEVMYAETSEEADGAGVHGEYTHLYIDSGRDPDSRRRAPGDAELVLDRSHSSADSLMDSSARRIPLHGNAANGNAERSAARSDASAGGFELTIFADRSLVEVFINGRSCLTFHVYPISQTATGLRIRCAVPLELDMWELRL